jgi:hypothetical protein
VNGSAILAALAVQLGPLVDVSIVQTPWHSASYSGERVSIWAGLGRLRHPVTLADIDFDVQGWFVADAALVAKINDGDSMRVEIELLTIDAR